MIAATEAVAGDSHAGGPPSLVDPEPRLEPARSTDASTAPAAPRRRKRRPRWLRPSHVAGRAFGWGMRLVPARHRFTLAVRLAGTLAVPMRASRGFVELSRGLPLNSAQDLALNLLLRSMTASGAEFDVPLRLEGEEVLEAALASGRGTVLVSPHALLSRLLLRHLYDRGHRPTIIGGMNGIPLSGTRVTLPTVYPSRTVLVLARRRLHAGGIVCANVDHLVGRGKNTSTLEGPRGEIRFSDSIFRLAVRCDARVVFTLARAEATGVRQWIGAPRPASAGSPEAVARDFAAFVEAHTAYLRTASERS